MITFFDLIQNADFRRFVSKRIESSIQKPFSFPAVLPPLYKYRSLSPYAIDDLLNSTITLTSIGEFNDVFDGAIHQYGTLEEIEEEAEAQWAEMEAHRIAAHLPEGLLRKEDIVKPYIQHLKTESRLKFRELDYLGTYVCCFSEENSSTLMWAHYADSNKGICIEYDFNKLPAPSGNLLRESIFPIVYTVNPLYVSDLLTDTGTTIYEYPIDAAVLCTALNKASMWQYEQEWRIVWVLTSSYAQEQRITINALIKPSKIIFGYHFLKPFFYYNNKSDSEFRKCREILRKFLELVTFMCDNNITAAIMVPIVGSYQFKPCDIPIDALNGFMLRHFQGEKPQSMRYYYVVHDYLMDLIERVQEGSHA